MDYSENYSPVVHDITFCVLILAMMIYGYPAKIVDVETAFLYGDLDAEIYMKCPEGLKKEEGDVLTLTKCIYGLVQSARQYHKKATTILKDIGFVGGDVDPCLYMKRGKKGTVFLCLYVDDNLLIGDQAAIDDAIKQMKQKGLILKVKDSLKDYLSCEINFSSDKKRGWLGQPHLISNLEKKFKNLVKDMRVYKTPGTPGMSMIRETDQSLLISKEKQTLF